MEDVRDHTDPPPGSDDGLNNGITEENETPALGESSAVDQNVNSAEGIAASRPQEQPEEHSDVVDPSIFRREDIEDLRRVLIDMYSGIASISRTLKTFPNRSSPSFDDFSDSSPPSNYSRYLKARSKVKAEVRDCNWTQFMNHYKEDGNKCAIEVLVSGANLTAETKFEEARRKNPLATPPASSDDDSSSKMSSLWIHRVRIQSIAIVLLLRLAMQPEDSGFNLDTKTFIRPFRLFIWLQPKAEEEFRKLKDYLRDQPSPSGGDDTFEAHADIEDLPDATEGTISPRSVSSSPSGSVEYIRTDDLDIAHIARLPGAVEQIQCYIDFVESRIMQDLRLFSQIHEKPLQVRWEDLWYVFREGDLVYRPFVKNHEAATTQKIWRILFTKAPSDVFDDEKRHRRKEHDFTIHCYYIDYDGVEYSTIRSLFVIKEYQGECDVTSLLCYPLRFEPNHAQVLEEAQASGETFVKYTELQNRYGSYSGWTLIHNPVGDLVQDAQLPPRESMRAEHLNSNIIVDMRE